MSLKENIQTELKEALKNREEIKLQTLRLLSSAIHNEEISKGSDLKDADIQTIVKKEVKKRKEAIEGFRNAGRDESADKEAAEMKILEEYLPEMMSEAEVAKIVDEEIANNPDADMGRIIGAVMKRVAGNADGAIVSKLVKEKLSQS